MTTKIKLFNTQPSFPVKIYGCYANEDFTEFAPRRSSEFPTLCTLPKEEKEKLLQVHEDLEGVEVMCTLNKKEGGKSKRNNVYYTITDTSFVTTSTELPFDNTYTVHTSYDLREVTVYNLTVTVRSHGRVYEQVSLYLDPCSGTETRASLDTIRELDAYKHANVPSLLKRDNTLDAIEEYVKSKVHASMYN